MKTDFYRRQFLAGALLWLLPAVLWAPAFSRAFVSEDLLILARLHQDSWGLLVEAFTGPWLGIDLVKFYRPVSTTLLALEQALFGSHPLPYALTHWLVHGLNAWLLLRLLRSWTPALGLLPPAAVAALFAIYPLHLNAVLFIASFATLFAATFGLAFLLCFLRWRSTAAVGWLAAGTAFLALALGSYEGAAVLPAVALALDLFGPAPSRRVLHRRFRRRWLAVPHALFFGLLCAYLLLRRGLFGQVLGGYDSTRARLLEGAADLAGDLLASLFRLLVPIYGATPPSAPAVLVAMATLGIVALGGWVRWGLPRRAGASRPAGGQEPVEHRDLESSTGRRPQWGAWLLLGPAWTALHQAPFAFAPVVPGNGRYWYLAAAGAALVVLALVGLLGEALRSRLQQRGLALPVAVGSCVLGAALVLGAAWGVALRGYAQDYARAGELTRALPRALAEHQLSPGQRIFITGYPLFVHDAGGAPVAQVFRWGLRDALRPPFHQPGLDVLPLPDLSGGGLLPVADGEPAAAIFRWDAEAEELRRFVAGPRLRRATTGVTELEVLSSMDPQRIRVAAPPGTTHATLFVVTAANTARLPLVVEGAVEEGTGEALEGSLPLPLLRAASKLYPEQPAFWWVEARSGEGELLGYSVMRRVQR
ncbi:MAG: hypothetical protein SX243_24200 [Acidobacteriota bacterium]|nr:hypothetical protein [Acidobacteriota bacterium]